MIADPWPSMSMTFDLPFQGDLRDVQVSVGQEFASQLDDVLLPQDQVGGWGRGHRLDREGVVDHEKSKSKNQFECFTTFHENRPIWL